MSRPKQIRLYRPTPKRQQLVTVYRLNYPGHSIIQQYYQYVYDEPEADSVLYIESCPGCGAEVKYSNAEHRCSGRLTDNPVDNRFRNGRGPQQRASQRDIQRYILQQNHPVYLDE